MSLQQAPNFNDYITRAAEILQNSIYVFPRTIGLDTNAEDLVSKIISYRPSNPENPDGADPPYVFIQKSENGILKQEPAGRDDRDKVGPMKYTLEIWCIVVALAETFDKSQAQSMDIASAIQTTFGKNKAWNDRTGANPIAVDTDIIEIPFLLESSNKDMVARNVVLRPKVFVNMR